MTLSKFAQEFSIQYNILIEKCIPLMVNLIVRLTSMWTQGYLHKMSIVHVSKIKHHWLVWLGKGDCMHKEYISMLLSSDCGHENNWKCVRTILALQSFHLYIHIYCKWCGFSLVSFWMKMNCFKPFWGNLPSTFMD